MSQDLEREIVVVIDCDISDREVKPCKVDNKGFGSCGERADYCMWALWEDAREIKHDRI